MKAALRLLAILLLAVITLQVYFAGRILMMRWIAPESTTFERSEIWRLALEQHQVLWAQRWVDGDRLSRQLKRAVIASEDSTFVDHGGVDWDAVEKAYAKNEKAEARAEARAERNPRARAAPPPAKIVGGSTISQQLAKNLFLSGERHFIRKGQELLITLMLEALLDKDRILTLYLNHVEWGEGVFGAEAAAHHYFRESAAQLGPFESARLAVMLPAPKRFEKRPNSPYVLGRSAVIVARMPAVELP
ncbi:MAG: monofunctional biosynthetic peptidoglycan transglycosylase [Pelomonas sp.]|nr:monofunctional biosynthetic peptidoglycan transglycosylase [Roseateles sp.]